MKKAIAIILGIILIMAFTFPTMALTKVTVKSTKKFSLKMLTNDRAGDAVDLWQKIFQKEYPNAKFKVITSVWGAGGANLRNKQLIMISSGDSPDFSKMVWSKEFAREGILTDITKTVKQWATYAKLSSGQLDRMTYNGKHYAITMQNNSCYLFYNKDILAKVGVTAPPKTLDEMLTIAKKIKDADLKTADGKTIYTMNYEGGIWTTDYFVWANGGDLMTKDFKKSVIDSPETIKAFQWMQDTVKNGYAPKPDGAYDKLWVNGQLAFFVAGDWEVATSNSAKLNYGCTVTPKGSAGVNTVSAGGAEIAIFKASKYQKESLDALKVIWSDEFQKTSTLGVTNLALYKDPGKLAVWKKTPGLLEAKAAQLKQLNNVKYNFLDSPFIFPEGAKIYADANSKILVSLEDPATVLKDAAAQINKGIAEAD